MPEEQRSIFTRLKGLAKTAIGIKLFINPLLSIGVGAAVFIGGGTLGLIGNLGSQAMYKISSNPVWKERSKGAKSFGHKAMLRGASLMIPFAGAIGLFADGAQNIVTGKSGYFDKIIKDIAQDNSPVADLPPPHHDNQHHQTQDASHQQQIQPAVSVSTEYIARAANFEDATKRYQEEVRKKPEAQKYKMVGDLVTLAPGLYEATYIHPSYTGDPTKCPEELKVRQQFNDKMELIAAKIGANAQCTTPPIKKGNDFELLKLENGRVVDCRAAAQNAQAMRGAGLGTQSHTGPAPSKAVPTQGSRTV